MTRPPPAKLVVGALVADPAAWAAAEGELEGSFGPLEPRLLALPFAHSDYYRGEMGGPLLRVFRVLREPVAQDALVDAKLATMRIEELLADRSGQLPRRRVNLDPGVLHLAGLVLASTKGYAHRVYLGRGIHAEPELVWRGSGFRPLPWTYADYAHPEALAFFRAVRADWKRELRRRGADLAPELQPCG